MTLKSSGPWPHAFQMCTVSQCWKPVKCTHFPSAGAWATANRINVVVGSSLFLPVANVRQYYQVLYTIWIRQDRSLAKLTIYSRELVEMQKLKAQPLCQFTLPQMQCYSQQNLHMYHSNSCCCCCVPLPGDSGEDGHASHYSKYSPFFLSRSMWLSRT